MDQEPNKRNGENSNNSTMVWFALIIVVALAVSAFLIMNQSKKKIQYRDFQRLLEVTKYDEVGSDKLLNPEDAKIIVRDSSNKLIEFTQPTNIKIGTRNITGKVKYRVSTEPDSKLQTAHFVVNKDNSEKGRGISGHDAGFYDPKSH